MKISIIMSTYNGEKYLVEQLESIRLQTLQPDEIIISDDCSVDNSKEIIAQYIQKYNLSNWKYYVNKKNLGWEKNFIELLQQAKGDYIFPCDQDDIWNIDKLEKMIRIMEKNQEICVLASNYAPFYMENCIDKPRNQDKLGETGEVEKRVFDHKFLYVHRPGCVYCVRKDFVKKIIPFWFPKCPHDALLWCFSLLEDGLYIYQKPTIKFRRHSNNASSMAVTSLEKKRRDVNYYMQLLEKEKEYCRECGLQLGSDKQKEICKAEKFLLLRKKFLNDKSLMSGLRLVKYLKYYYATKTYIGDWGVLILKRQIER